MCSYEKFCLRCGTSYHSMLDHCPVCGVPSEKPVIKKKKYSYFDHLGMDREKRKILVKWVDGSTEFFESARFDIKENYIQITEKNGVQQIIPIMVVHSIKIKEEKQNA